MGHADPKLGTLGRRIGAVAGIFIGATPFALLTVILFPALPQDA